MKKIDDIEKQLIGLTQTQSSHINTLILIIKHIRNTIKLSNVSYRQNDYEEMKIINDELIEFIDELLDEEYND